MRKRTLIIAISIILIFILVGCGKSAEEKLAENLLNKNIEAAGLENQVQVGEDGNSIVISNDQGNVNIGEDQEWPEFMPEVIPIFKGGEVFASSQMGQSSSVTINYDDEKLFNDYLKKYTNWTVIRYFEDDVSGEISGLYDDGTYEVFIIGGIGQITITVNLSEGKSPQEQEIDETYYNRINFEKAEATDAPTTVPEFTEGIKTEVDMSDFPNAIWVKSYFGVEIEQMEDYLIKCQDNGYKVESIFDSTVADGVFSVTHSKSENLLAVTFNSERGGVLLVYGKK